MNRLLISLASLAIGVQAFAGDGAVAPTPRQPVHQVPLTPLTPQLTSAKFLPSEVLPGEYVKLQFDGINLAASTSPAAYAECFATPNWAQWPAKQLAGDFIVASNGVWQLYPVAIQAPNLPGTYVITFQAYTLTYQSGQSFPCTSKGPITATLVVKKPHVIPVAQGAAASMPALAGPTVATPIVKPNYVPVNPGNPGKVR